MKHEFNEQEFRQLFPEFMDEVKYPSFVLNSWFTQASFMFSAEDSWLIEGDSLKMALYLLTAHISKTQGGESGSGAVTSATEGTVSVSYIEAPVKNGWQFYLSGTPYGTQLWFMLQGLSAGGFMFGGLPETRALKKVGGIF